MISLRRLSQTFFLTIFLLFLFFTSVSFIGWVPVKTFFYLDPVLALNAFYGAGSFLLPGLYVFIVLLFFTLILGRFFCAYICPWGTTYELAGKFKKSKQNNLKQLGKADFSRKRLKFFILISLFTAFVFGVNYLHWVAPFSLCGRFYILVSGPFLDFILQPGINLTQNILDFFNLHISFLNLGKTSLRFQGLFFLVLFFFLLLGLALIHPRFWCRYLCPSGALLALVGHRPLIRRKVSKDCTQCGLCRNICPMEAIGTDPHKTDFKECIVCQQCVHICPEQAISFGPGLKRQGPGLFWPSRREFIFAAGLGSVAAFTGTKGLHEYWPDKEKGQITRQGLIRAPGSRPEDIFLLLCLRCGLCLRVCPTNMLQPAQNESGLSGMFTPVAVAGRGACEPECNACGQVCPSGAIRALNIREKQWAKMGTAVINRQKCLAWEFDKACLICDEACPYGAIELKKMPGLESAVPLVKESKCAGCGFCEYSCPVRAKPAIVVTAMAEQRLDTGSYITQGKRIGLDISRKQGQEQKDAPDSYDNGNALPPGFG